MTPADIRKLADNVVTFHAPTGMLTVAVLRACADVVEAAKLAATGHGTMDLGLALARLEGLKPCQE